MVSNYPMLNTNIPAGVGVPSSDPSYDYLLGGFRSVTRYGRGLLAITSTRGHDGVHTAHMYMHSGSGNVTQYATGWTEIPLPHMDDLTPGANRSTDPVTAVIAAQRVGTKAYALVVLPGDKDTLKLIRFDGSEASVITIYETGGALPVYAGQSEMFVSEDAIPYVWIQECYIFKIGTSNFSVLRTITGFADNAALAANPSSLGARPWLDNHRPTDAVLVGAYWNVMRGTGQLALWRAEPMDNLNATFVHPWSAGDYGPPEIWRAVPSSSAGVTKYQIIQSRWRPDTWLGYATPAELLVGRSRLAENPFGWAFENEGNVYDNTEFAAGSLHKLGAIVLPSNAAAGGLPLFRVVRDASIQNMLHFVMVTQSNASGVDNNIEIWTAVSVDDGQSWGPARKVPAAAPLGGATQNGGIRGGHVAVAPGSMTGNPGDSALAEQNFSVVRTADNVTLVTAVEQRHYTAGATLPDAGVLPSFIIADDSTASVTDAAAPSVVFKRGENRGTAAWS